MTLPAIPEDPSYVKGEQVQASFVKQAQAIRSDPGLSDLAKAQQVIALWESSNAALAAAWQDLQTRRQTRLEELQSVVPVGPEPIPAGTTPADSAILMQSWRSLLAQAQAATPAELGKLFGESQRFGDTALERAVLTVAAAGSQPGDLDLVKQWASLHGHTDELAELFGLYRDVNGTGLWSAKLGYVLGQIKKPAEVSALPSLTAAATKAAGLAQSRRY
jgi:hypothetical protein